MSGSPVFAGCSTFSTKRNAKVGCVCTGIAKESGESSPLRRKPSPHPWQPKPFPNSLSSPKSETAPPETDVLWEAVESPEETTVIEVPEAAPPPSEPPAPVEAAPEKKMRKIRPAKPSSRRGQRKATSRRKPKETTGE